MLAPSPRWVVRCSYLTVLCTRLHPPHPVSAVVLYSGEKREPDRYGRLFPPMLTLLPKERDTRRRRLNHHSSSGPLFPPVSKGICVA